MTKKKRLKERRSSKKGWGKMAPKRAKEKRAPASKKGAASALAGLEKKADALLVEISSVRQGILDNESSLQGKISQKIRLEDELNSLLRERFEEERRQLSLIRQASKKKEAGLKGQISSLERVNQLYEAKRAKIIAAKKRYNALKMQLERLNKGSWA